jgi:hypothetical protein
MSDVGDTLTDTSFQALPVLDPSAPASTCRRGFASGEVAIPTPVVSQSCTTGSIDV